MPSPGITSISGIEFLFEARKSLQCTYDTHLIACSSP